MLVPAFKQPTTSKTSNCIRKTMENLLTPTEIAQHMENGVKIYGMKEFASPYLCSYRKQGCAVGSIALSLHSGNYKEAASMASYAHLYEQFGIKKELVEIIDDLHSPVFGTDIDWYVKQLRQWYTQDEAIKKLKEIAKSLP